MRLKWPRMFGARQTAPALYYDRTYLKRYSASTDQRVDDNPHEAVGGLWDELGQLQFEFLIRRGLQAHDRLLDIGCGTLRGGRHFIRYLDIDGYTGLDISPKAIEYAEVLVQREGLVEKKPRLVLSKQNDLRFHEFSSETFEYLLAQSVFTHLPAAPIEECFRFVGSIMTSTSRFFFTYNEASRPRQTSFKDFGYPKSFFKTLAKAYQFELHDWSPDYPHPRGQRMLSIQPQR